MFTQCPQCHAVYRVRAETLRAGRGMVRCRSCRAVFSAIEGLRDDPDAGEDAGIPANPEYAQAEALSGTRPPLPDRAGPSGTRAQTRKTLSMVAVLRSVAALGGRTLGLALRNVLRHRRRTGLAVGAIGFGVVSLVLAGGFIDWMMWAERESTIHSHYGHIQVVRRGYFEAGAGDPYAYLLSEEDLDIGRLRALPYVQVATPRVSFSGLVSRGETTVSFLGLGVDPAGEADVSREVLLRRGEALSAQTPDGVLLGKGLAESLGADVGDTVVLLATAANGGVSAVEGRVAGVFQTAVKAYDDVALRVPIELAGRLLKTSGTHSWVVLLDQTERTEEAVDLLAAELGSRGAELEVVPWYRLADFYNKVVELFTAQMGFVRAIIGVIILMSISNTLIMSVMERTAEIGTLMALGVRRSGVMRLFVTEGLVLGMVGGLVGALLGYGLARVVSAVGIPMPPAPGMDFGFTAGIRLSGDLFASAVIVALAAAVAASLYPAWKASRLEIVDALRRSH